MQMARNQLFVRLSLLIAAICAVFLMIGGPADANEPVSEPVSYVVAAGDTLWEVAAAHTAPGEDVRRTVKDIEEASNVAGGVIYPGQTLLIPTA